MVERWKGLFRSVFGKRRGLPASGGIVPDPLRSRVDAELFPETGGGPEQARLKRKVSPTQSRLYFSTRRGVP
jgi:hypothetical protein